MLTCVNGVWTDQLATTDRGLAYGDGVFETCRLHDGELLLWAYHRQRLLAGTSSLSIELSPERLASEVDQFLAQLGAEHRRAGVVKIIVTRGQGGRGYGFSPGMIPNIIIRWSVLPPRTLGEVELPLCHQRLSLQPALAGIKHLNRLENVLLKMECQSLGVDDGLAVSMEGCVVETTHSNLVFSLSGELITPMLDRCGVKGVMRRYLMDDIAPRVGVTIAERDIKVNALAGVAAALVCNSVRGVVPVSVLAGRTLGSCEQLQKLVLAWRQEYPQA